MTATGYTRVKNALIGSPWRIGVYLLVFVLGVILSMTFYCLALSGLLQAVSESRLQRWAQPLIATGSCLLGIAWIVRAGLMVGSG